MNVGTNLLTSLNTKCFPMLDKIEVVTTIIFMKTSDTTQHTTTCYSNCLVSEIEDSFIDEIKEVPEQ